MLPYSELQNTLPPFGTFHGGLRNFSYDHSRIPLLLSELKLLTKDLWGGLVCGDYGCIPHRLVLKLFHTNRWRYSHSRVGIHYGIVINHLITGMKPLLLITITLFHL